MTSGLVIRGRRVSSATLLLVLLGLAIVVALLTPEAADLKAGGSSSRSAAPGGTRMMFELAQRMGWQASRRDALLDSLIAPSVQVVIAPQQALGAVEVHRLLDNVRRGGGLIFEANGGMEIADSLGVWGGGLTAYLLPDIHDTSCKPVRSFSERTALVLPPDVRPLRWRRPPPGVLTDLSVPAPGQRSVNLGEEFSLGAGRVVVMGSESIFNNSAIRRCEWRADVAVVRALEMARPASPAHPRLVFDEYHHGSGAHGGSMEAVSLYLSHTASGHFLAQALIAAFVLLFAAAPRAIVPREPERIARRSPLEHADALAHAYADVDATRTAASRLVSGLRRRAGRTVTVHAAADDTAFLDAVVQRTPSLAARVAVVRHGLSETVTPRDFVAVGDAIRDIETQLTTTSPTRS